jgi:hypothetical protein
MRSHRALSRAFALTLGLAAAGTGVATPAAAAARQPVFSRAIGNVVSLFGEAGDPVTGGTAHVWRTGPDAVTMSRAGEGVRIRATSSGGERFDFLFQPRVGQQFTGSEYPDADAAPSAEHGALQVTGAGRSCAGGSSGDFQVLDVDPDLSRLWVLFEQRCAGAGGSSFGEIRINEAYDPALLIAPSRVEFPAKPFGLDGGTVPVTLINTGSAPITFRTAEIAGSPSHTTTSPVGDDTLGLAGTLTFGVSSSSCGTLQPGESCVVLVTYRPLFLSPVEAHLRLSDSTAAREHDMSLAAPGALAA